MTGQSDGHYVHYSSIAKPHHAHLAPHPYHRLTLSRVALLGAKASTARHSSPCTKIHPSEFTPTGTLTVPISPIIPSLPVRTRLPLSERKEPKTPKSTPPMSIATTTTAPSNTAE